MGSSPTKPQAIQLETQTQKIPQNPELWSKLKERQMNQQEMTELGQKINQPLDQIEKAVKYLEKQGIIIENGLLGAGGSGFVLKACSEQNEHLAVKLMKYQNLDSFENNKREYDILKKFNSNYITKVYQYLTESHNSIDYQIIVMERCVYDLKNYITKKISANKLLSHQNLYSLCLQLSRGLQELHKKNIIHLDIKPANILLGLDLKWKYADLGVSKVVSENRQHTKNLIGFTATYSSPEQYQLMTTSATPKVSKSSDIYSLGVVFLQLTGVDVSQKWIIKEKISAHNYDRCLNPYYEEFNHSVIKKMMQYEADDRLTVEEVIHILRELQNQKNKVSPDNINQNKQDHQNLQDQKEDKHENEQQLNPKKLKEQDNQECDQQRDQVKILKVEKGKRKIKIRPVSTYSLNQIFNSDEKAKKILEPSLPQPQRTRIYSSQKQALFNPNQNEKIYTKPLQSERIRNYSSQPQLLQIPTSNDNLENKLVVKLPYLAPSYGSIDGQAQLSTKDSKKKFIIPSLSDFDQFQSNNNFEKKSSNNLPSIDEFKSPQLSRNNIIGSQQVKSRENIQNQRYINIIQQLSSTNKQQMQQEYHMPQKPQQQYIFVSPDKQSYSKKFFSSNQLHANIFDQRTNKFGNPFSTPFNPF